MLESACKGDRRGKEKIKGSDYVICMTSEPTKATFVFLVMQILLILVLLGIVSCSFFLL